MMLSFLNMYSICLFDAILHSEEGYVYHMTRD